MEAKRRSDDGGDGSAAPPPPSPGGSGGRRDAAERAREAAADDVAAAAAETALDGEEELEEEKEGGGVGRRQRGGSIGFDAIDDAPAAPAPFIEARTARRMVAAREKRASWAASSRRARASEIVSSACRRGKGERELRKKKWSRLPLEVAAHFFPLFFVFRSKQGEKEETKTKHTTPPVLLVFSSFVSPFPDQVRRIDARVLPASPVGVRRGHSRCF